MSMVRTRRTSYMTDLRRLTVAFSRGRLGLYLFGKYAMMKASKAMNDFLSRAGNNVLKLAVQPQERWSPESFDREVKRHDFPLNSCCRLRPTLIHCWFRMRTICGRW
eukprot:Gregarina_sp_Poly_1__3335@NODE_195_length_11596_cov_85_481395_g174_i0_p12_GENE_NODE_195_length_11596_cov_85_481395_g174_i0NODE_195_length_11596_cov_85_481395_g174_i0_p12_ORF_typecomplete_len107_score7_13AAA_12/PF13087_6/0_0031AAA_12/PF13087_6/5_9e03_NODE_195_length_11596_cov_85_481395_g174_i070207340